MSVDFALKKLLPGFDDDLDHFISAYPTQILLRTEVVKGTSGGADGKAEYIGLAPAYSLLTQPRWQVRKLIYYAAGFNTQVLFADGSNAFDKVMNSYATFTYTTA